MKFKAVVSQIMDTCIIRKFNYLPNELRFMTNIEPILVRAGSVIPWDGLRTIAIVPVFNRLVDSPPPADWEQQIRERMFSDPDPITGFDRSFKNYLSIISYGRASISGTIFPAVWADNAEVNIPAMNSLPSGHNFTKLLAVLPHSFGDHRGGYAFWGFSPINGIDGWARVALYSDSALTMRQTIGVWMMEILHIMTGFLDLYTYQPNLEKYDVMADAGASTHPCAHTKNAMGWLSEDRIITRLVGAPDENINFHAIAINQPPPDRVTALKIPSVMTSRHYLVESRLKVDPFERGIGIIPNDGIPKEGILIYEVADTFHLYPRTQVLSVGEKYENLEEKFRIEVTQATPDGFSISIHGPPKPPISLKDILIAKGISFPVSIRSIAEDFGLTVPFSVRELIQRLLR